VAEHEANRQRHKRIRKLFGGIVEEKKNEIKFAVHRYVFTHLTGLSNRVRIWKITPVFKIKGKYQSGKSVDCGLSHTGQMIN